MFQPITIQVTSRQHTDFIDVTSMLETAINNMGLIHGTLHCFTPHTTCGLTINENADPDVVQDLIHRLEELAPWRHRADKHGEGNSAAHLKSSLMGCQLTIPVSNGQMQLGTWQGVYLCEFDGKRTRNLILTPNPR